MKQLNTYSYASGEVSDAENLIECIEANRRGYASISIYNLSGSAIPVMKSGSTVEIGGTMYTAESDETAKFYDGATFFDATYANVPSGTYFLALVPSSAGSSETTELTLCIMSISSYEYNQDYRGWYQTNTLNRLIGGLTITNSGSAITASDKWLLTHCHMSYTLENPANPYFRLYSDGVEGVLRVNTDEIDLYTSTPSVEHMTRAVDVADFTASCPSQLVFKTGAVDYGTNADVSGYSTSFDVILYACDKNGTVLGELETKSFTVGKFPKYYSCVFNIVPGFYYCQFIPRKFRTVVKSGAGSFSGTIELFVKTYNLRTYLTNIYGAKKGTY